MERSEIEGLDSDGVGLGDDLRGRGREGRRLVSSSSTKKELRSKRGERTAPRACERLLVGPRMTTWSEVSLGNEGEGESVSSKSIRGAKQRMGDELDARELNNASSGGKDLVGVGSNEESVLPLGDRDGKGGGRRFLKRDEEENEKEVQVRSISPA